MVKLDLGFLKIELNNTEAIVLGFVALPFVLEGIKKGDVKWKK